MAGEVDTGEAAVDVARQQHADLVLMDVHLPGIGVRDAILVLVLGRYGYNTEQALTLSALYLLINIEQIVVGFLVSLRYPLGTAPPADVRAMDMSR